MVALTLYSLSKVITEYAGYPVDVIIKLEQKSDILFPAVTVCNINPTRKSQFENSNTAPEDFAGKEDIMNDPIFKSKPLSRTKRGKYIYIIT